MGNWHLARRSGVTFAGIAVWNVFQFLFVLELTRQLGRSQAGVFLEGYAALNLLAVVALMGLDVAAIRFVAIQLAYGERAGAALLARKVTAIAAVTSVATSAAIFVVAPSVAGCFSAAQLPEALRILAVSLPFIVIETVLIGATRGAGGMRAFVVVDQILNGAARVAGIGAALALGYGLDGAAWGFVAASIVVAAAALVPGRAILFPPDPSLTVSAAESRVGMAELTRFAGYQWMASLVGIGLFWADTLLLGLWRSPAQVAVYSIAVRTVLLGTVFILPIGIAFQPLIGRAWAHRDTDRLRDLYVLATKWSTLVGCPPLLFVAIFAAPILTILYGPAYGAGATPLALLAIGQLANALTGPCGHVITMAGRTDLVLQNTVAALAVNLVLNLILIPPYGGAGAGAAWGVSMIVWNGWRTFQVWHILRIHPFDRWVVRALPVVAAFGGTALACRLALTLPEPVARVLVSGIASTTVLVLGLAAFGMLRGVSDTLRREPSEA